MRAGAIAPAAAAGGRRGGRGGGRAARDPRCAGGCGSTAWRPRLDRVAAAARPRGGRGATVVGEGRV